MTAILAPITPSPEPLLLSASQIKLFTECQRRWGFRYLEKLEQPDHPAALLGKDVHEGQLGPYFLKARPFDFTRPSGEIANALVPLLPPPSTAGIQIERQFVIPSPSGLFGYLGFIDLYAPDSACVPGLDGGRPLVGDFKTTSDFRWAKTEEILKTDIQAQIYAAAVMFEEGVDEVDLVWFYTRTKGARRAQRVHLRVGGDHVVEQFHRIDEIGREVAISRGQNPKVNELKPNARMCDAYGGCPYRNRCNLSPAVHAAAINEEAVAMESKTDDFLAQLRKGAGQPQVNPTPAAAPPVPAAFGPGGAFAGLPPPSAPVSNPPAPSTPALPAWATAPVDPGPGKSLPAINPPESLLPPAPPVGVAAPAAPVEAPKKRGRPPGNGAIAVQPNPVAELRTGPLYADITALAKCMRESGIARITFPAESPVLSIELFAGM